MNKTKLLLGAALLMLLPLTSQVKASATPDIWNCSFNGTWTEDGKPMGAFTWSVKWDGADDKWKVSGTSKDDLGTANTTGSCGEKTCKMSQTYTSGELKGKTYAWDGTYEDADGKTDDTLVETFKGTWGDSPTDRKNGGTWQAKAVCKAGF